MHRGRCSTTPSFIWFANKPACVLQARALSGWLDYVEWKQRSRLVVGRALAKLRHGMMATAFLAWLEEAQAAKLEATLAIKQGTEVSRVRRWRLQGSSAACVLHLLRQWGVMGGGRLARICCSAALHVHPQLTW